ncbi:MAG: four helix bundle protein [Acidobacteria bacterium]|nr:four helix bundle protein [Acidobacteriota bacterium]MBI3426483.1 four helix bundle protein [Acidobacteriota bacterium]
MAAIRKFEEIKAWQKARELAHEIYKTCGSGAISQDYGLRNQICRAAVSSMSNIAEGFGHSSNKDFAHFLDMARGSTMETQSLLYVALDIGYINQAAFDSLYKLAEETSSLIIGFSSYLRANQTR